MFVKLIESLQREVKEVNSKYAGFDPQFIRHNLLKHDNWEAADQIQDYSKQIEATVQGTEVYLRTDVDPEYLNCLYICIPYNLGSWKSLIKLIVEHLYGAEEIYWWVNERVLEIRFNLDSLS